MSFSASMRASSSGPMSLTVARTGWPCSPNTSQSVTGHASDAGSGRPRSSISAATLGGSVPGCEMPVRSPLTSARNTGTPCFEKFSASVWSVIVLPVPVAPVTRPWRLASAGSRWHSTLAVPGQRGSGPPSARDSGRAQRGQLDAVVAQDLALRLPGRSGRRRADSRAARACPRCAASRSRRSRGRRPSAARPRSRRLPRTG